MKSTSPKLQTIFQTIYPPASDHAHPDIDDNNVEDDVAQMLQYEFEESSGAADMMQRRLRIIGEVIGKLSPHFARLCLCLKPVNGFWPNGNMESAEEFKQRIVCHSYIHLLRCLSAMLSMWVITIFQDDHGIQLLGICLLKLGITFPSISPITLFCLLKFLLLK